jgi:hypothetical protein
VAELPIPTELDAIVMTCLEKKPEDRFQTAAALEAALGDVRFEVPWTLDEAREWWELHGLAREMTTGVEAPPSDEEGLSNRGISRFIFEP